MRESGLWARIKRNLKNRGDFVRIENSAGVGQPDINYCIDGREGWIELKHKAAAPARPGTRVFGRDGLRTEQELWFKHRLAHGGRCCIIAQVSRMIFVIPGECYKDFNEMTMQELRSASRVSGSAAFDWATLIDYLKGELHDTTEST